MNPIKERLDIPVEEYGTPNPETATPDATYRELLQKMKAGGFRHLLIVTGKKVVGLVSERDLKVLEGLGDLADKLKASDFMATDLYIDSPQACLEDVVFEMSRRKIGSAILQDGSEDYLGIFTSTDAMNALVEILRGEVRLDN